MSSAPPIENHAGLPDQMFERLAAGLRRHTTMRKALDWLLSETPPKPPKDIVAQDEFSYDVIVPYADHLWLVYSVT